MFNIIVIPYIYVSSYLQGALSDLQIVFKSTYSSQILWEASWYRFCEYCLKTRNLRFFEWQIQTHPVRQCLRCSWHPGSSCFVIFCGGLKSSFLFNFFLVACFLNTITLHSTAWSSRQNGICWFGNGLILPSMLTGNFSNNHKLIVLGQSLFKYLVNSKG